MESLSGRWWEILSPWVASLSLPSSLARRVSRTTPTPMTPGGEEYVMCDYCKCRYNTKLGIYKEGCGIENVIMSWGHDEYLYHVSPEAILAGINILR